MKISFLPANLHLTKRDDGTYRITLQDEEVFSTKVEKKAVSHFNKLRQDLAVQFPAHEMTPAQKTAHLRRLITDSKVGIDHNSRRPEVKSRKSKSTRTFG